MDNDQLLALLSATAKGDKMPSQVCTNQLALSYLPLA